MELTIREVVFPRKSGPGELTITPFSRQEERSPTRGCFQDFFRHCEGTAQQHNDGVEHVIVILFLAKQALERIKKAHSRKHNGRSFLASVFPLCPPVTLKVGLSVSRVSGKFANKVRASPRWFIP